MRFFGVAETKAKLSEAIDAAQTEPVVVLSHGKPAVVLLGVAGLDLEDIQLMGDAEFWRMLRERRKPGRKMVALEDLDAAVAKKVAKKAAVKKAR